MQSLSNLQHGIDDYKPSLFELLSEQQLSALIPPSLRYVLTIATHRHPRYLLRLLNSFDEAYAILMLVVERYYLEHYGGSYTEHFYGLKRERSLHIKGGEAPRARSAVPDLMHDIHKLDQKHIWKNLVVMVGIPYIKRKLDESFEIYGAPQPAVIDMGPNYRRDSLPINATLRQKVFWHYKWFLRKLYPSVNAAYFLSLLAFHLAYLFDNTRYSSPFLWMIGTRIRRLDDADQRALARAAQASSSNTSKGGSRPGLSFSSLHPAILAATTVPKLLSALRLLLPTSIFALKFLEWWHASDFARQLSKKATEGIDLPPPTVAGLHPVGRHGARLSQDTGQDPAAFATSGTGKNSVALSGPSGSDPILTGPDSAVPVHAAPTILRSLPPISSTTQLPILTVPVPTASTPGLCPICRYPIQTATSVQTGYVFCYTCIFRWVDGSHARQTAFMEGRQGSDHWNEDHKPGNDVLEETPARSGQTREGEWESGKGRCAITGRRVLGCTDGLRRVMV